MLYLALAQFCINLVLIGLGIILLPDKSPGIEIVGLVNIFGNWGIFNPGFTYTENSNDIVEAIIGGIYCSLIPGMLYGMAIWYFGSFAYGLTAGLIFIAGTIVLHYSWNKIICCPKAFF
jgi:hypothetical protein